MEEKTKKNIYCEPKVEIVVFSADDVIAESRGPMRNVASKKSREYDFMNYFN